MKYPEKRVEANKVKNNQKKQKSKQLTRKTILQNKNTNRITKQNTSNSKSKK